MTKKMLAIRRAVAELIVSSGCDCCRSEEKWGEAKRTLAMLLAVPMYEDQSGFDFSYVLKSEKE